MKTVNIRRRNQQSVIARLVGGTLGAAVCVYLVLTFAGNFDEAALLSVMAAILGFVAGFEAAAAVFWRYIPTRGERAVINTLIRSRGQLLFDRLLEQKKQKGIALKSSSFLRISTSDQNLLVASDFAQALSSSELSQEERMLAECLVAFIDRIGHKIGTQAVPLGNHVGSAPYYGMSRSDILSCQV